MVSVVSAVLALAVLVFVLWRAIVSDKNKALAIVIEVINSMKPILNRQLADEDIRAVAYEVYDAFLGKVASTFVSREAFADYCVLFIRKQLQVSNRAVAAVR